MAGQYGRFEINADGSYTYTLNNTHPKVDALNDGDTLTDSVPYTITDGDGDDDTAQVTLTITILGRTDGVPSVVVDKAIVSEEGLVKGILDTQGSQDTTNDTTAAGQIVLTGLQNIDPSELSIKLSSPERIQVQGKDVVWHWSDQSNTLTGRVSLADNQPETDVMTIKVNDIQNSGTGFTASYQTALLHAIDHPQQNIEDGLDVKFNLQVTQGAKPLLQSDLIVTVEDDSPFVDSGDIFFSYQTCSI